MYTRVHLSCINGDYMTNIFSIDVEEWFHSNFLSDLYDMNKPYEVRVLGSTYKLLEHFSTHNAKGTFFCLSCIAEKHPALVKDIQKEGHEIASHGANHALVYSQTKEGFREDVYKSKCVLEDCIQKPIKGYRAPSWSITKESLWALDILQELGFIYDSSIFPIKSFLYGIKDAERFMGKPFIDNTQYNIYEVPPSTFKFLGKTMGFSGGFYFRAFPLFWIKRKTRNINKKENKPAVFYLHPREIDVHQPKLELSKKEHFIQYLNIRGCEKKLINVLRNNAFTSIENYYDF